MIMIEGHPFPKVFPLHFRSFSYFIRTFLKKLRIFRFSKEASMLIVSNFAMATIKIGINTDSDFMVKLFTIFASIIGDDVFHKYHQFNSCQ